MFLKEGSRKSTMRWWRRLGSVLRRILLSLAKRGKRGFSSHRLWVIRSRHCRTCFAVSSFLSSIEHLQFFLISSIYFSNPVHHQYPTQQTPHISRSTPPPQVGRTSGRIKVSCPSGAGPQRLLTGRISGRENGGYEGLRIGRDGYEVERKVAGHE